jgi:hypothetical protein
MKHKIVLLLAALFCLGGMTSASAAAPSMDLSHYWHHHYWHHHYYHHYYWHHHYYHHYHHWHHYY